MVRRAVGCAIVLTSLTPAAPVGAATPVGAVVDGTVAAIARSGSTIYLGGRFTSIGPNTGGLVSTDDAGVRQPSFPAVAGRIYTVVRDPRGGWFVGGDFSSIGGQAKANLARLRRDGQVDDLWTADTDAPVLALATSGSRLYVGGGFSRHRRRAASRDRRSPAPHRPPRDGVHGQRRRLRLHDPALRRSALPRWVLQPPRRSAPALPRRPRRGHRPAGPLRTRAEPTLLGPPAFGSSVITGGSFSRVGGAVRSRLALIGPTGRLARWGCR